MSLTLFEGKGDVSVGKLRDSPLTECQQNTNLQIFNLNQLTVKTYKFQSFYAHGCKVFLVCTVCFLEKGSQLPVYCDIDR